jgi:hypothetical protein
MVSCSSSTTTVPSAFSMQISEKLTKSNYLLWHAQVIPAIRAAAKLEGFLTCAEKTPSKIITSKDDKGQVVEEHNPAYSQWVARDQAVLGYLLSSLTRETLVTVVTCTCAADVWSELSKLYSSQARARTVNTRIALATTRKNKLSVTEYYSKMRSLADDMASTGTALRDDEFVSYILAGLDKIITLFTVQLSPTLSPSHRASCMHNSSVMSNIFNYRMAASLSTPRQPTQPLEVVVCCTDTLVGRHVAEVGADLVACHTAVPTSPVPGPTLALILSAKYASR